MKNLKEKQLLINFAKALGQEPDPKLLEEIAFVENLKHKMVKSVKENSIFIFKPLDEGNRSNLPEENPTKEESKEIPQSSLIDETAKFISEAPKESFQQPNPPAVPADLQAITGKLRQLEQWVGKISMAGSGSGAGDVINLDFPVKLITNNYTITRKDYYVGVNAVSAVTITLPDAIGFPGRKIIIKDESGNCASNPITVLGNVDNDQGGFILQMDNGGIQMIYREGWRII